MKLNEVTLSHHYADLGDAFGTRIDPTPFEHPKLIHVNPAVLELLGIDESEADNPDWARLGCGSKPFKGSRPFAMKYTGHQFGVYNPDLGDGRALLLGELEHKGKLWDLHLKGAGKTPYSRFGDGRAVLRSTIREYLAGEALHGLGIRATRALCLVGSDEPVTRERIESGAMLIRVAETHIRFGHFEYLFYTRQLEALKQLIDFTCERFLPEAQSLPDNEKAEALLRFTVQRSADLAAGWQAAGFAHGVLNTDNMSIIGDTFDFGPYGFLDDYEPEFICNHSDHTGRYAFEQQPGVVLWNLNALAHAFSAFVETDSLKDCLEEFQPHLVDAYAARMRSKLGLATEEDGDRKLCADLLQLLADSRADYPLFFRALAHYRGERPPAALNELVPAAQQEALAQWLDHYDQRLAREDSDSSARNRAMLRSNPKFVLRNYLVQKVIDAAEGGDYRPLQTLFELLQTPFDEHPEHETWAAAPPESGKHMPISCSS
ncbi:protein adenylyltransferase SelO [Microbulbifer halophilus]|uniref:Protein nucleotidyltransferase YdiU n=1 Tax=Microbulbifer halophilus TaxID=453963 RepID=A0ABW5E9S1_9GAMM|nr:YdiU family protein [Microbulbifer halophilus]MCW8126452.1 YdiU family protein [Microbulbifer halophilus]